MEHNKISIIINFTLIILQNEKKTLKKMKRKDLVMFCIVIIIIIGSNSFVTPNYTNIIKSKQEVMLS